MGMGHPCPSHQWDIHKLSLFLLTPLWARGIVIIPKVLHKHLLLRRQATWVGEWVEVKGRAHRPRLQGPRGVSTSLHFKLSLQINWLFRVLSTLLLMGKSII